MSKPLFSDDEDSNSGDGLQLTINEHYAKAFEYRKEREELERLRAKYGSDYDPDTSDSGLSTDSESAESEDEDGEELTPTVGAAILRTLARIKKRDPAIYDSEKNIFGEEQQKITSKSSLTKGLSKSRDKSKPVTIRQAKLDLMLHGSRSTSPEADPVTYVEEQEKLRKDTIAAFHGAVPVGEEDDFLIAREKTKDELDMEEAEYRAFLEREVGDLKKLVSIDDGLGDEMVVNGEQRREEDGEVVETDNKRKGEKKKEDSSESGIPNQKKSRAEKNQEFLMNYILNRGWIDRSERHVPTYEEITSTKRKKKVETHNVDEPGTNGSGRAEEGEEGGLLSDSSFDSLASHFEASYNHRFEEPGAVTIPTFPRNIQSTVRRQDTTRKEARERRKARKEEDVAKKREEVRILKALKMREVRRKLEIIGRQAGLKGKGKGEKGGLAEDEEDGFTDEALHELDLDGDWNPEKHDQQMASLFERDGDAFEDDAANPDEDGDGVRFDADGKPIWDDDIDIGDVAMPDDDVVEARPSQKEKKRKKKKKKDQGGEDVGVDVETMDADAEPVFEDNEEWDGTEEMRKRVLKKYMDDLDNLDFNDMVGDLATRFKYVPVQSTSYSLTTADILMATNKELNEYVSVKKYAPYRLAKADNFRFAKVQQDKLRELKSKVGERTGRVVGFGGQTDGEVKLKKRKGKKERMRMKSDLVVVEDATSSTKRKRDEDEDENVGAEGAEGEGYPVVDESGPKKKRKRKHKKEDKTSAVEP